METPSETITTTHWVPTANLPKLQAGIEKLNKRAHKIGAPPIMMYLGGTDVRKGPVVAGHQKVTTYREVTVTGKRPMIANWELLARLERTPEGVILRVVPGNELPTVYRDADPWCDHCNLTRNRRDTFVVRHLDGTTKQVGSNCLADFLGHKDPQALALYAEYLTTADDLAGEAEDEGWGGGGGGREAVYDLTSVLAMTAATIRGHGWVSKAVARQEDKLATATRIDHDLDWTAKTCPTNNSTRARAQCDGHLEPTDADVAEAKLVVEWGQAIDPDTPRDYLYNLRTIAKGEVVTYRTLGYATSMVAAYRREREWAHEREVKAAEATKALATKANDHLGTVGERLRDVAGVVTATRYIDGQYGTTTLVKIETPEGNALTWFASYTPEINTATGIRAIEAGDEVVVTGTVKRHAEYQGRNETQLTRCKLISKEEAVK